MLFCNPAVCVCRQSHGGAAFLPLTSSRLPGCRRPGEGSQGVRRSCFAFSSYFSCHSWCDGFPELVHEKAAVAGLVPLRPDSEASPASVRRSSAEEAARFGAAAGRREGGTVGEDPGAGAAVPAHRPRQGGRFGRFSPGGDNCTVSFCIPAVKSAFAFVSSWAKTHHKPTMKPTKQTLLIKSEVDAPNSIFYFLQMLRKSHETGNLTKSMLEIKL